MSTGESAPPSSGRPGASEAQGADPASREPLTYAQAGVDIEAGNEAVRRIKSLVASTRRPEQLGELGGFAGMIGLPSGMREPVLVGCTDGVGTKLLVAMAMAKHDTVGIDLVAMCVNDLLVTGAQALFLLDYIATGELEPGQVESIVAGVAEGCRQSKCALLGGETAELPGMYQKGHYDLAASAVGVVDKADIWSPERVTVGDVAIGLPSSGLHSNGFSLARKALLDPNYGGLNFDDPLPGDPQRRSVGQAMLEPTRIYEPAFAVLRKLASPGNSASGSVHGAAHITGGGLLENPQRALQDNHAVHVRLSAIERPAIMQAIAAQGVEEREMRKTFNCGLGMIVYVDRQAADLVIDALREAGEQPLRVGEVVEREGPQAAQVLFPDD